MVRRAGFERKFKHGQLRFCLLEILRDRPMRPRELADALGVGCERVYDCLRRLWKKGLILRTKHPVYVRNEFVRVVLAL